jgi:hypothetical protein
MLILHSASEVIDALGGTKKAAEIADRSEQSMSNARLSNRLPCPTFRKMTEKLANLGMEAPPELWGQE